MYVRIGFTQETANNIVDDQGIDSIEEVGYLKDPDIDALCKTLNRPGGTIANPNAGNAGQPDRIPNPGHQVSLRAEGNIKLASYWVKHQTRISRTIDVAAMNQDVIRRLHELKDSEQNHKDPDSKPTINDKNWAKTLEAVEEHLRNYLGETKIPLSYVVRREAEVPPQATDPSANYPLVQDEMIRRASHQTGEGSVDPVFEVDNRLVWTIIADLMRDHKCWRYVKPFQRQ